jgi:hypothetical protein
MLASWHVCHSCACSTGVCVLLRLLNVVELVGWWGLDTAAAAAAAAAQQHVSVFIHVTLTHLLALQVLST